MSMTLGNPDPGAPFSLRPAAPEMVITDLGKYDAGEGIRVVLQGEEVIFLAAFNGATAEAGVPITTLLDAIGSFTRAHES